MGTIEIFFILWSNLDFNYIYYCEYCDHNCTIEFSILWKSLYRHISNCWKHKCWPFKLVQFHFNLLIYSDSARTQSTGDARSGKETIALFAARLKYYPICLAASIRTPFMLIPFRYVFFPWQSIVRWNSSPILQTFFCISLLLLLGVRLNRRYPIWDP